MLKHYQKIANMYYATWRFRQMPELSAVWKTPSPKKCRKFAATECGELMDIELREEDFARNSEKQVDYLGELADVGIMLCSAMPMFPKIAATIPQAGDRYYCVDGLHYLVADANFTMGNPSFSTLRALDVVCELFEQAESDPVHYVRAKLERTYRKFVKSPDEIIDAVVTLEIDALHLIDYETLQEDYGGSLMDVINDIGVWDAIDYSVDAYKVVKVSMK